MIVWVKKEATDAACNQRARVDRVSGGRIYVTLLGSDEPAIVMPDELCGLELQNDSNDKLTVMFQVTFIRTARSTILRPEDGDG